MTRSNALSLLRNFGIIAHVDAGKTTLTERILLATGRIHRAGKVDDGSTTTDSDPEERKRGITIGAAAVTCSWRDHALTLVDTPGHADFTIEVERSLRVLDGAVVVLDGVAGVEPRTEGVWRQADRYGVPRIAFVNKLDRTGADLERTLVSLRERLGVRAVPIALPIGEEADLEGVVDLVERRAFVRGEERALPAALEAEVDRRRHALIEACADVDEGVIEGWLHGDVRPDDLVRALRKATCERLFVPVLCGSAHRGIGVELLLDAIVALLPAPEEGEPLADPVRETVRARSAGEPLAALCFKVAYDSFGALSFVRMYAGTLRKGALVTTGTKRKLRIGRLVRLFGGEREDVEVLHAGEIGALLGVELPTGDTLSDPQAPLVLEPVRAPHPVLRIAIEPRTRGDRDRLGEALRRLTLADPSLAIVSDEETSQTLLAGMGQLHLEIAVERLAREHGVALAVGAPRVAYRETITRAAHVDLRYAKQTGGPGEHAHVICEVAPAGAGAGLVFEDRVRAGAIPKAFIPGVRKGFELAAQSGPLGGYPLTDVRMTLLDGSFHSNDSSEHTFEIAGRLALQQACREAGPALLEPWMRIEVRVPTEHVGDVVGDLSARRGRVLELRDGAMGKLVDAEVPLARLFGYATDLGSLARGRGAHTMKLSGYELVPDSLVARALERG